MPDPVTSLDPRQRALLGAWLPGARVVRDHSRGLTSTVVLEVAVDDRTYAVRAAAPGTGWTRLAVEQFDGRPDLELAFVDGHGSDPSQPDAWRRHRVGDAAFEAQELRMLVAALGHDATTREAS